MNIYYLLIEARPCSNNNESKEFGGAYVNCWVNAKNQQSAINAAKQYIDSEGWETINIEEVYLSSRDYYDDEPDLQSCFDLACKNGIGAIFNTWPLEEDA
ncbi:MAG: hypothetical protein J5724_00285 [Ruminococcus sp.]|nr:hypothetical protein [Ruminococcus sp.]